MAQTITETTCTIAARDVKAGDTLVSRTGNEHFLVDTVTVTGKHSIRIALFGGQSWTLAGNHPCKSLDRAECDGTCNDGVYYGRGVIENGVFKGVTGTCFRCSGKGYTTPEDRRRNWNYDNYYRRIY